MDAIAAKLLPPARFGRDRLFISESNPAIQVFFLARAAILLCRVEEEVSVRKAEVLMGRGLVSIVVHITSQANHLKTVVNQADDIQTRVCS